AVEEQPDELRDVIRGTAEHPGGLVKAASVPPANSTRLQRSAESAFRERSDLGAQAFGVIRPDLRESLAASLERVSVTSASPLKVFALRVKTAPFGHNAPMHSTITEDNGTATNNNQKSTTVSFSEWTAFEVLSTEDTFAEEAD